ncbi:hypothetical protein D3C81_1611150 [compost metagenome]
MMACSTRAENSCAPCSCCNCPCACRSACGASMALNWAKGRSSAGASNVNVLRAWPKATAAPKHSEMAGANHGALPWKPARKAVGAPSS